MDGWLEPGPDDSLHVVHRHLLEERSAVEPATLSPFSAWENFYVILGSSAAALTGLQFVVVALGAEARSIRDPELGAFGTPTIVHFCAVLLISAIVSAPWHDVTTAALVLVLCGAAGLAYTLIVVRRAWWQTGYAPVLEDWLWHGVFPFLAYSGLLLGALALPGSPTRCLFTIATTALVLLFIGIHNAWDAVTFIAMGHAQPPPNPPAPTQKK
jgi:hypothetical protein